MALNENAILADVNTLNKIPIFSGDEDKDALTAEQMISRVTRTQQTKNWSEEDTANYFTCALTGRAKSWAEGMVGEEDYVNTWAYWSREFKEAFGSQLTANALHEEIKALKQQAHKESAHMFSSRCANFTDQVKEVQGNFVYPNLPEGIVPNAALQAYFAQIANKMRQESHEVWTFLMFRAGVKDKYSQRLTDQRPQNRKEARRILHEWELEDKKTTPVVTKSVCEVTEGASAHNDVQGNPDNDKEETVAALYRMFNKFQNQNKGFQGNKPQQSKPDQANKGNANSQKFLTCYYCQKKGHTQNECHSKIRDMKNGQAKPNYQKKVNAADQAVDSVKYPGFPM